MDERLHLRDDTIFQLKQERCVMQQRIKELKSEIDELECQLSTTTVRSTPFKAEGMKA